MRLSVIADWLAQPDRRGGGIMVRHGSCGMVGGVIETDVKAVCCDGDNGIPWRAQGTREQDREWRMLVRLLMVPSPAAA